MTKKSIRADSHGCHVGSAEGHGAEGPVRVELHGTESPAPEAGCSRLGTSLIFGWGRARASLLHGALLCDGSSSSVLTSFRHLLASASLSAGYEVVNPGCWWAP